MRENPVYSDGFWSVLLCLIIGAVLVAAYLGYGSSVNDGDYPTCDTVQTDRCVTSK